MYAICAIFKNEGKYLREWLEFHSRQGFDTFYLYNNESTDEFKSALEGYNVILTDIKTSTDVIPTQIHAYTNCFSRISNERWCAFIDIDEFLFCKDKKIFDFLKDYEDKDIAGIGVNWILYGSSGYKKYSDEKVINRFVKRDASINGHIKSIVRPVCGYVPLDPHYFAPSKRFRVVNENKKTINGAVLPFNLISADKIRINHYFTKSEEEYIEKMNRGRADFPEKRTMNDFYLHDKNDIEDLSALTAFEKKHFYQNIDGWFDFQEIYSQQVRNAKNGSHFVEVGAWLGKSTSFMAVEIFNSGKRIKYDVIDTWKGSVNETNTTHSLVKTNDVFQLFLSNLKPVENVINPIQKDSVEASKLYSDESLDFIFIDANHQYEYVKKDILAWLPKLKKGGYMGGHDYNEGWTGVIQAVDEIFGSNKKIIEASWLYHKTA